MQSPFLKAIVPAVFAGIGSIALALFAGGIDAQSISIAIGGLVSAVVTYLVPNTPTK